VSEMPRRRELTGLDALEDYVVGDAFETAPVPVDAEGVQRFSELTGDFHPLHTDEEYARHGPFGRLVAHGLLTLSLAVGQVVASGVYGQSVLAMVGIEDVRFIAPVYFGDSVKTGVQIEAVRILEDGMRGVVSLSYGVRNQHENTVLTFKLRLLVRRRTPLVDVNAARTGAMGDRSEPENV
jgi:acyl dehydratase